MRKNLALSAGILFIPLLSRAEPLVTKVEKNRDLSGVTVSFRNGIKFQENRETRRLTIIFPNGEKKILEGASLFVNDGYIDVLSKAEHQGKPVLRLESINRKGEYQLMWLSYVDKNQPDSLHGVEIDVEGRAGDGAYPLGGGLAEIPTKKGDGSYDSHGVNYVPLIRNEWLRDPKPTLAPKALPNQDQNGSLNQLKKIADE